MLKGCHEYVRVSTNAFGNPFLPRLEVDRLSKYILASDTTDLVLKLFSRHEIICTPAVSKHFDLICVTLGQLPLKMPW
jgi:hypothetical protein